MGANKKNDGVRLTISVVSHGQGELVAQLLTDLQKYCTPEDELIITLNIEEHLELENFSFQCPVQVIQNNKALGFAANQNQAFSRAKGKFFCVMNPDILLPEDPFSKLLASFSSQIGLVAPKVVNKKGETEKSARDFPTPLTILKKAMFGEKKLSAEGASNPDWVAGMFMIFPAHVFNELNGFDEGYFLYYEDVDICARLKFAGYNVLYCQEVTVQHDAQWKSHTDTTYRRYHLQSMLRFFSSKPFMLLLKRKLLRY